MEVFHHRREINQHITSLKKEGKAIGFVPTMGALHDGHISLVHASKQQNDITVVSIFVNPTQFNNKEDLAKYPRTLQTDLPLLEKEGCDMVFVPDEKEMYPEPDLRVFSFGNLDKVMEGKYRPGHFNGIAQVVTKLIDIISPHRAYFGFKDFQQLIVIKKLIDDCQYPVEIVSCPIVREADGLAMSSRNIRLSPEERKHAALIPKTLLRAKQTGTSVSPARLKKAVTDTINKDPHLQVEYFEIVDDKTLQPVNSWDQTGVKVGCIAVYAGNVRLIDNITFNS
ncbi:MAG: pantoate--beta-alanine ligase [Bacteroidales bacterium]|nr:pantoate--beta-alanine ligase [Bacteroidales bacterium]